MKILILGGSGMLGHRLWLELQNKHEVWVSIRGNTNPFPKISEFPGTRIRKDVDARYFEQITRAFASIQPDLVINCIGLIKQYGHLAKDPLFAITLNAQLPHRISLLCRASKIRMIHISTDCVFSGKQGNYSETDEPDAGDIYGRTKHLGEVLYDHCVTLRTSIIGQELSHKLGLIEWFLNQKNEINGYTNAIFSGLTTIELSKVIKDYVIPNPDLSGLYHISADPINKFDLLNLVNKAYDKKIKINQFDDFYCDRSLDSSRFREKTGYQPPSWSELIEKMAEYKEFYQKI